MLPTPNSTISSSPKRMLHPQTPTFNPFGQPLLSEIPSAQTDQLNKKMRGIVESDSPARLQEETKLAPGYKPISSGSLPKDTFVSSSSSSSRLPVQQDIYTELFGTNLQEIHFKQQNIGNCYFLAALDAILHHREGERMLRSIQIEKQPGLLGREGAGIYYKVVFPGRPTEPILVDAAEIGRIRDGKRPVAGPKGVQLLELAYGKLIREEREEALMEIERCPNDGGRSNTPTLMASGDASEALQNMLGGTPTSLSLEIPSTESLAQDPDSGSQLKEFLTDMIQDVDSEYLLTAETPAKLPQNVPDNRFIVLNRDNPNQEPIAFLRNHTYSVRLFHLEEDAMEKSTITVADPQDTKHKEYTLSLNEFCRVFNDLNGIWHPKPGH